MRYVLSDRESASMSGISGVYLTGWEYNRILDTDPLTPRNSALPGEILWSGAAYLWLFETVYCTHESYMNELAADSMMGWRTGGMFAELESMGILQPIDWKKLKAGTSHLVNRTHDDLRKRYGANIKSLIKDQDYRKLEQIKIELVKPVATSQSAIIATTPNSLSRPTWREKRDDDEEDEIVQAERVQVFLSKIVEPISKLTMRSVTHKPALMGLRLCDRPGTGVDPADVARQNEVQHRVEADMIPDLLAGEGVFSGEKGYEQYFQELQPYRRAYEPINIQLLTNWTQNKDVLFALRSVAKKHLWPQLHEQWLPELIAKPESAPILAQKVAQAVERSRFAELLTLPSLFAFGLLGASGGTAAGILSQFAHLDPTHTAVAALTAGSATSAAAAAGKAFLDRRSVEDRNVALFYQTAKRLRTS
jgi:hypothetical protein